MENPHPHSQETPWPTDREVLGATAWPTDGETFGIAAGILIAGATIVVAVWIYNWVMVYRKQTQVVIESLCNIGIS